MKHGMHSVAKLHATLCKAALLACMTLCGCGNLVAGSYLPPTDPPGLRSVDSPAGSHPDALQLADFDGDGILDAVVAETYENRIHVLRGLGDGRFLPLGRYPAGSGGGFFTLSIADVNGDQFLDILYANPPAGVLFGRGNGSFVTVAPGGQTATTLPGLTVALAAADLDRDGLMDLISAHETDEVAIHFGLATKGGVEFTQPWIFPGGDRPRALTIVDLDGDKIPDVLVSRWNGKNLGIYRGGGRTGLMHLVDLPLPAPPRSVAAAQIDTMGSDGVDLVVALWGDPRILVLKNRSGFGKFAFDEARAIPSSEGVVALALGPIIPRKTEDMRPDLVVCHLLDQAVGLHAGGGDGTFGSGILYGATGGPSSVALGDVDRDGLMDIVFTLWDSGSLTALVHKK